MTAQYNVPLGYAQCRYVFSVSGLTDAMGFTLGVFSSSLTPSEVAEACHAAFLEDIWTFGTAAATSWTWQGVQLTTQLQGGPDLVAFGGPSQGTIANPTCPPNCCMLVRKNTALGGRKNRGRIFFPAAMVFEVSVDAAGFQSEGTIDVFNTQFLNFYDQLVLNDVHPQLYHQYDPALGELPEVPTPITSFSVQPQLATQRLRMR
jgi:hypothetical protein